MSLRGYKDGEGNMDRMFNRVVMIGNKQSMSMWIVYKAILYRCFIYYCSCNVHTM